MNPHATSAPRARTDDFVERERLGPFAAKRHTLCRLLAAALMGLAMACGAPLFAENPRPGDPLRSELDGLTPASDRDAEAWLKRAEEAAESGEWKLAIDTLMRVVDQHGDKTVSPDDGRHFFSARRCAQEQIRSWPAEGLQTYRLLHDPEAKALLDTARATHDLDGLWRIAKVFPMTSHGPPAMDLLAAWLIDQRRPSEAIELLHDLLELPHGQIPRGDLLHKLVVAYAIGGDLAGAERTLSELEEADATTNEQHGDRVKELQTYLTALRNTGARGGDQSFVARIYPGLLGPPAAAGRAGSIDPAVTPETALLDTLPGSDDVNLETVMRISRVTGRPPVWQMVSDGRALFVSCADGVTARDLDTFEFLWKSVAKRPPRDPRLDAFRVDRGTFDVDNSDRLDEAATRTLFHEYRGAISTALGLVFVIEQSWTPNEQYPTREGVPAPNNIFAGDEFCEPNSLRAYEADTGRAAWTKGRGGPVEDGLRAAHFLAPPVLVTTAAASTETSPPLSAQHLVAPVQIGADLFLLVFNRDGETLNRVLLGTGQPGMFPMNGVLCPTVFDGTVYVQTGAGMMIALSALDYSLRWQTNYDRAALAVSMKAPQQQWGARGPVNGRLAQPDEWLASPPMIVGGIVIVAAPDSEHLLAFNRINGKLTWSFPRGTHRYLVGSDGQRVFVAGRGVLALDVSTGRSAWSFQQLALLGRPALCGDDLWLPTEDGLLRLKAETGEATAEPLHTPQPPGNLLALDGALYNVSATGLTKFPDIAQSRSLAEQTLAVDPTNPAAILRLAHLEILQKDWLKALELLQRADPADEAIAAPVKSQHGPAAPNHDHGILERVRHQKIMVLLRLAQQSSGDQCLRILERAARASIRLDDRVESGLALADALMDRGRPRAAFELALTLLEVAGDQPMRVEDDLVSVAAVELGDRLRRAWDALAADDKAGLTVELASHATTLLGIDNGGMVDPSQQISHLDRAVRWADALGIDGVGTRLDLQIGRQYAEYGDTETASFFLRRCLARSRRNTVDGMPGDLRPEAALRLAIISLNPGVGQSCVDPGNAVELVRYLETLPKDGAAPQDLLSATGAGSLRTYGEWARALRNTLPAGLFSGQRVIPSILRSDVVIRQVRGESIAGSGPPDARSFFDPRQPIDIYAGVVPIRLFRQIKGVTTAVSTGGDAQPSGGSSTAWSVMLDTAFDDLTAWQAGRVDMNVGAAATAGPMAVLDADGQYIAVGLTTGRVLWPSLGVDRSAGPLPEPGVIRVGDMIVASTDAMSLLGIPARGDARPIWRRRWSSRVGLLSHHEGRLVVIDRDGTAATLLDAATGRLVRRVALGAPLPGLSKTNSRPSSETEEALLAVANLSPVHCGGFVIYTEGTKVACKDLASGHVAWDQTYPVPVRAIRVLDDMHAAIVEGGGDVEVVKAGTGRAVLREAFDGLEMPPMDMVLNERAGTGGGGINDSAGARLIVFTRTLADPPQTVLVSVPIDSGKTTWRRELGRYASVSRQMMRASADYVAAVQYIRPDSDSRLGVESSTPADEEDATEDRGGRSPRGRALLNVFDKWTGERLFGNPYAIAVRPSSRQEGVNPLIRDVIILDTRIIAVGLDGYYVLAIDDRRAATPLRKTEER